MASRRSIRSLRLGVAAILGGVSLLFVAGASAGNGSSVSNGNSNHTSAGDKNAGDVWTDNVGQPAGPGHEQDPHLKCADINLWGNGLADSSGTYTIDGWPPSGSQEEDYSSTWSYDTTAGGTQVISVINVGLLTSTATANGDSPINKQGLHFKLQFVQDPQKHKTFWVTCKPAPTNSSTTSTGGVGGASSSCTENCGGGGASSTCTAECTTTTTTTTTSSGGPSGGAAGVSTSKSGPNSGVAGISTSTPGTGAAALTGLALALIAGGATLVAWSRRRGRQS